MSIKLELEDGPKYKITLWGQPVNAWMTLDEIEDLEIELTGVIKKLQDYRMSHESKMD